MIDLFRISARRPAARLGRGGGALALVACVACLTGPPAASADDLATPDTTAISSQYQASEPPTTPTPTEALVASVREEAATAMTQAAEPPAPAPTPPPAPSPVPDGNSTGAIHQNPRGDTTAPPAAPAAPSPSPPEAPAVAPRASIAPATPAPAAEATQTAAAAAPQAAPTNINVAINILSPGDRGPVVQTSTGSTTPPSAGVSKRAVPDAGAGEAQTAGGGPTSWTWTWNWSWGTGCGDGASSTNPTSTIAGGSWNWTWDWNWECAPDPPRRLAGLAGGSAGAGEDLASAAPAGQGAPPSATALAPGVAAGARRPGRAARRHRDRKAHRSSTVTAATATGLHGTAPLAGLALLARPSPGLAAAGLHPATAPATAVAPEPRRHGAPPAPVRPPAQPPIDASSTTALAGGLGGAGGGGMAAALLLAAVALVSPEIFTRLTAAKAVRRPKPRSSRLDRPG